MLTTASGQCRIVYRCSGYRNAKSRELISAITLRHGGITIDRRDPTAVAMVGGELQPLGTTTADDSPLDTPNRSVGVNTI